MTSGPKVSRMLNVGDQAPDFSLPTDAGSEISLDAFKGKTVVLFFFPKADTPGCTSEANQFRDAKKDFDKLGATLLGVSADPIPHLKKFRDKYKLNFPLAGDTSHKMLEDYGVWQEKNLYGRKSMGIVRTTYIIDPHGKIRNVFPKVKADGHALVVLSTLKAK
jgi:thioredoxin-dependent peroxiredoxin